MEKSKKIYYNFNDIFNFDNLNENAFEELNLSRIDYYTIRDLMEFSGIKERDKLTTLFLILLCMFDSLKNGSICIKLEEKHILEKLYLLTGDRQLAEKSAKEITDNRDEFKKLIGSSENDYKPLILKSYNGRNYLYFQKYFIHEKELKSQLDRLLSNSSKTEIAPEILNDIISSSLDEKQRLAVYLGLQNNFTIISGGPGTGKTFIIYFLIKMLVQTGVDPLKIKLSAPTGRASQRLTESILLNAEKEKDESLKKLITGIQGETIHRILKFSEYKNDFTYDENNRLPAKVLIVDEVSMVDLVLMTKLLKSLPDNAKIIFIGDKNQIPSVDAGAVLADLVPADFEESFSDAILKVLNGYKKTKNIHKTTDRIVLLEKCYRTNFDILKIAGMINLGDTDVVNQLTIVGLKNQTGNMFKEHSKNPGALFIKADDTSREYFHRMLIDWIKNHFIDAGYLKLIDDLSKTGQTKEINEKLEKIFKIMEDSKILSIVKEGLTGVNYINSVIKNYFEGQKTSGTSSYFPGMPVIINRNDYGKKLFNGDTGVIIKDITGLVRAVFKRNDTFVSYPVDFLPPHDTAFAITVHESQGSEYGKILVVLPDNETNPLLTREILYTALTRSKSNSFIYAKETIFKKCITTQIIRESGINLYGEGK